MTNARQPSPNEQTRRFHDHIEVTLKGMVPSLATQHGVDPIEVLLAATESAAVWLGSVAPATTAEYLAALAWVMREKACGAITQASIAELTRATQAVRRDLELMLQQAQGRA